MTESIDFSITRKRLLALLSSLFCSGLLLYGAGIVTGMLVTPGMDSRAPLTTAIKGQSLLSKQKPVIKVKNASPAPSPSTGTEKAGAGTAATASLDQNPDNDGTGHAAMRLSIQVASFRDENRAQRLADTLKQQGFGPISVGQSDVDQETWHVIRLGPYRDWDNASQIAAELQRSYDLQPVVREVAVN